MYSGLTDENEQLIRKLRKLKKKNNVLEEELRDINEKLKFEEFVKHHTLTISVCTQTDLPGYKPLVIKSKQVSKQQKHTDEQKKQIDSLLKMHKNLMKKYQKELKHNAKHLETIAGLNLRVQELETQLTNSKQKVDYLERNRPLTTPSSSQRKMRRTPRTQRRRRTSSTQDDAEDLRSEVNQLRQEKERLAKDRKLLKKELGALDDDFFEELEDLKFALQQSAKLNKEYQRTLEKLSQRFGFPLPDIKAQHSERRSSKR
ncbi:uncharacterized protein [Apostichopus japonicus]|uniref:uncharacterized protein isoform X2 n=1 Tax=Stichopus japonicus TaxID=307972 RepID=UPI003AB3EC5E